MFTLVLLMLGADGGAMTPWDGTLEQGATYALTGYHDPEKGIDLLKSSFTPPRLKLPYHHAGRVEWVVPPVLPRGRVTLVFEVVYHDVQRLDVGRWNDTWRCRLLSVKEEPAR